MGTMITPEATRLPAWSLREWTLDQALRWGRMGSRIWRRAAAALNGTVERTRQRRALARLDSRMLQDLGLQAHHVDSELRKWFWQI